MVQTCHCEQSEAISILRFEIAASSRQIGTPRNDILAVLFILLHISRNNLIQKSYRANYRPTTKLPSRKNTTFDRKKQPHPGVYTDLD